MEFPRTPGEWLAALQVPWGARREALRDVLRGLPHDDPGAMRVATACANWLRDAQDNSRSRDGGVARHFSLLDGWRDSYPETTGYIVPTMLDWARVSGDQDFLVRARRMLNWLVSIQFENGAFAGGTIWQTPQVPVTFNTGQVLIGLAAGAREWPEFRAPMVKAAEWLCETQSADGAWRGNPSPFTRHDDKAYESHVAWGLFEAARVTGETRYGAHGLANVRWALTLQNESGWFSRCCLDDPTRPLTHTIGYALRGVIEAYRYSKDPSFLAAAIRCADGVMSALPADGALPGRLDCSWHSTSRWSCLTGNAQIAHCWLLLDHLTGERRFRNDASRMLAFVRRTVRLDGRVGVRGGVKGSFPVNGGYCWWEYPNWAVKFLIDALLLESRLGSCSEMERSSVYAPAPVSL